MKVKQLSVFLENKPGALSRPIGLLARANLNVVALSVADTQQFGILRLIVCDWEQAMKFLEADGFTVKVTDVLVIQVPDAPGGLAGILGLVEKAGINLEYMYGFTQIKEGRGVLVFRFDNPDIAVDTLKRHGINPIRSVELFAATRA